MEKTRVAHQRKRKFYWGILDVLPSHFLILEILFFIVVPVMAAPVEVIAPEARNTTVLIITTIAGFLTIVVQQLFAAYAARRAHLEERLDREQAARLVAEQLVSETEKTRQQAALRANEIQLLVEQRQMEVLRQQDRHNAAIRELMSAQSLKLDQSNRQQDIKLDQIHGLVNSNLTQAMQAELEARRTNLRLLTEANSVSPKEGVTALIEETKKKITNLEVRLQEREAQTDIIIKQLDNDTKKIQLPDLPPEPAPA